MPCFFILKALKDILQHFKFANWWIGKLVVSFFWCHEQVCYLKSKWSVSLSWNSYKHVLAKKNLSSCRGIKNSTLLNVCNHCLLITGFFFFLIFLWHNKSFSKKVRQKKLVKRLIDPIKRQQSLKSKATINIIWNRDIM